MSWSKGENDIVKYQINWIPQLETTWHPRFKHALNEYVRPTNYNGYEYKVTTAGETDEREPDWPETVSGTVTDGTVVWTAFADVDAALDDISESVWEATGVTLGNGSTSVTVGSLSATTPAAPSTTASTSTVWIYSGTSGGSNSVVNSVLTASGQVFQQTVTITVT